MTPTTRALVAAARAGLEPAPGAAARVRAKLDLAMAVPAPLVATTGGLALKLVVAVAVVGGAGALALHSHPARATAVPAPRFDDVIDHDAPHAHVIARASEPAAPAAASLLVHRSAPSAQFTPAPSLRTAASSTGVSLAHEVELIDRAMVALRAGHADAALAAIAIYHHDTADRGQLIEDATAIDIEASCDLHRDVADKLAAFDQTWPSSAQRSRLTTACHR